MPISSHQDQVEVSRNAVASSFSPGMASCFNKYSSKRQSREIDGAMAWTFVSLPPPLPPDSYVGILIPRGDGIRRWGLWEVLISWRWNPQKWMTALMRETPQSSLAPPATWGHNKKSAVRRGPSPNHAGPLVLDVQPPKPGTINFCFL